MARVKQAIQIISFEIERLEFREDDSFIRGMINMAERLDKITHAEAQQLLAALNDKYDTLES